MQFVNAMQVIEYRYGQSMKILVAAYFFTTGINPSVLYQNLFELDKMSDEQNITSQQEAMSVVTEEVKTYYSVLGVETNATPAQINAAYKKLSLIYHPDRNADDETASAKLSEINEVYHTLNDPAKRASYDASVPSIAQANAAAAAAGATGAVAAAGEGSLAGMISNLASVAMRVATTIPMFSQDLPSAIVGTAKELCALPCFENPEPLCRVADLPTTLEAKRLGMVNFADLAPPGFQMAGKVERIQCNYYRLEVTPEMLACGFILQCHSEAKDKFKLLVFDAGAQLVFCENSHHSRDRASTGVTMFCNTPFDTFDLALGSSDIFRLPARGSTGVDGVPESAAPAPTGASSPSNRGTPQQQQSAQQLPPLFTRIKAFEASRKVFPAPGFYLLGIVGENYLGRSTYRLVAGPCKVGSHEIRVMRQADTAVVQVQESLVGLRDRYLAAKSAYEATLGEIKAAEAALERLVDARDLSYRSYVSESLHACNPECNEDVVTSTQGGLDTHASLAALAGAADGAEDTSSATATTTGTGTGTAPVNTELRVPRLRARRDSFQEVQVAAAKVATKAGEVVNGAAATASETASAYGGWMSQKLAGRCRDVT
jgi:DnaJ-domain-containing protein 1